VNTTDISTAASPEVPIGILDDGHRGRLQARALGAWRDAETQVQARWDEFLAARRGSRRGAFAAYIAALDAEEAAAAALAHTHVDLAAAV
jgi:hypothetical protein